MPGNRCSNCISCSFDCTYVEAAKVRFLKVIAVSILIVLQKRGPPKG
jgi:hypothetical protein